MRNWRLVRDQEGLNSFLVEFGDLSAAKKRKILDEMTEYLDSCKHEATASGGKLFVPPAAGKKRTRRPRRSR